MAFISKSGIATGQTIQAEHVTRIIDALSESGSAEIIATGSFTGSFAGDGSQLTNLNVPTASYAANSGLLGGFSSSYFATTGSNIFNGNQTINGNVTITGTASISVLHVTVETASVIYSSGSNQFGDAVDDTQTLIGTTNISGSLNVTGSTNIPNLTGSLFGTASYALDSDPFPYTGSAIITGSLTVTGSAVVTRLGIGLPTPVVPLHVKTTAIPSTNEPIVRIEVSDATGSYLGINNATTSDGTFVPEVIGRQSSASSQSSIVMGGYIDDTQDVGSNPVTIFRSALSSLTQVVTRPLFVFRNWSTAVMTILADGKVGIGTTTPADKLTVEENSGLNAVAYFRNLSATGIGLLVRASSAAGGYIADFRDYLNNSKFYIGGDGKIGIGTTTPNSTLDISGSAIITGSLTVTQGITGSLFGTASHAILADTASYSLRTSQTDVLVKNQSGYNIAKGVVVRITGSNSASDIPRIVTASYENDNNSANTLGVTTQAITNGDEGLVITEGVLTGINTSNFISGQLIYLGATGSIVGTAPVAPLHAVRLGEVIREQSNNGSIYVRVDNGYEIEELHDILITNATAGDLLVRDGVVWNNTKQLTGSYGLTGSLTATSFTGSLFGTASWAQNTVTASYVATSSFAPNFANTDLTQSAVRTYSTNGNQLTITSKPSAVGNIPDVSTGQYLQFTAPFSGMGGGITSSFYGIDDTFLGTEKWEAVGNDKMYFYIENTQSLNLRRNAIQINGDLNPYWFQINSTNSTIPALQIYSNFGPAVSSSRIAIAKQDPNATLDVSGSVIITGSLTVTQGITGSMFGTASWAQNVITASFAPNFANSDLTLTSGRTHHTDNNFLWITSDTSSGGQQLYFAPPVNLMGIGTTSSFFGVNGSQLSITSNTNGYEQSAVTIHGSDAFAIAGSSPNALIMLNPQNISTISTQIWQDVEITDGTLKIATTQSAAPVYTGTDGEIVPVTVGGQYYLYMWMNGAWRSSSFA